jgi:glucosamine 6-phosphate synthetase-like amidotransferase/phosphosugar isomerase protein
MNDLFHTPGNGVLSERHQHQDSGEHQGGRIDDVFPRDLGRAPVRRLKHRRLRAGQIPGGVPKVTTGNLKQEISDLPRALRETLEKGRPAYEALVRRTRWGDGLETLVGCGPSFHSALAGAYAFESQVRWPTVARPAMMFNAYTVPVIQPRAVLLAISPQGEADETLEAARAARSRGAVVLALTSSALSPLAEMSDGVFLVYPGEGAGSAIKMAVLEQAALGYLSLVAARVLKRHHPQLDVLEEEFGQLSERVELVLSQLPDAVRAFAHELPAAGKVLVVGGGSYHPTALQVAAMLREIAGLEAQGLEWSQFSAGSPEILARHASVLILSGSRCRLKKNIRQVAEGLRKSGTPILAVTDTNDQALADWSSLTLLLPPQSEIVGAILTLSLLGWVTFQVAHVGSDAGARTPFSADAKKRELLGR